MSPVREAVLPKKDLTSSHHDEDWFGSSDKIEPFVKDSIFQLPELTSLLVDLPDKNWRLSKGETERTVEIQYFSGIDLVNEIESPALPAKNKFHIKLKVKSIKRGRPSICDEVEL